MGAMQATNPSTANDIATNCLRVLMEAMARAVPCIARRISGIPELVEDGLKGILTPPGDATAMADALERLATKMSLRRKCGAASVEKATSQFNLADNIHALVRNSPMQQQTTNLSI